MDLVVGVEYDPLPVERRAEHHRIDLLREDMLVVVPRDHPGVKVADVVRIADLKHDVWASGHDGTGLDAFVANTCNRLGRFGPRVRHRSDDAIVLSALVDSGRAVALLPAMFIADDAPAGVRHAPPGRRASAAHPVLHDSTVGAQVAGDRSRPRCAAAHRTPGRRRP